MLHSRKKTVAVEAEMQFHYTMLGCILYLSNKQKLTCNKSCTHCKGTVLHIKHYVVLYSLFLWCSSRVFIAVFLEVLSGIGVSAFHQINHDLHRGVCRVPF